MENAKTVSDVNERLREFLKGQQGVRHELTVCFAPDTDKRRCPVCKAERHYKTNEFREWSCDGIRMRVTYPSAEVA